MNLPNHIDRCKGVNYEGEWREGCENCLRRTSTSSNQDVAYLKPPEIIAFWCEYLIDENKY